MPFAHRSAADGRAPARVGTLDLDQLKIRRESQRPPSTSRAVDALSITPPGGAAASIRCAIPTCSPSGGVTQSTRTDLARDDLAGIEANPQLQFDTVAVVGPPAAWPLRFSSCTPQRRQAGTKRRDPPTQRGRTEHRHQPVAGELVHRAAILLHHHRRTVNQFGHDLAQPFRTDRRRDAPSSAPRRRIAPSPACTPPIESAWVRGCTALVTELGVGRQFSATRLTRPPPPPSVHRDRRPRWGPRQYRVTAVQPCPSYRRAISDTKF